MLRTHTPLQELASQKLAGGEAIVEIKPNSNCAENNLEDKVELLIENVSFGFYSSHYTASEQVMTICDEYHWDDDIDMPNNLHQAIEQNKHSQQPLWGVLLKNFENKYLLNIVCAKDENEAHELHLTNVDSKLGYTLAETPKMITQQ